MIPLNNHVQIEPQTKEDFIASADTTYNEVGTVVSVADGVTRITAGDIVYFDSWMAAKYPDGKGGFYWLVPFDNIKAYEPILEKRVQRELLAQISYTEPTQSGIVGTL